MHQKPATVCLMFADPERLTRTVLQLLSARDNTLWCGFKMENRLIVGAERKLLGWLLPITKRTKNCRVKSQGRRTTERRSKNRQSHFKHKTSIEGY
jgi:hypothetical protein